jgi:fatty acid desaturase
LTIPWWRHPQIYQLLNAVREERVKEEIRRTLHSQTWVFVGDRFVPSQQVAFVSQVRSGSLTPLTRTKSVKVVQD